VANAKTIGLVMAGGESRRMRESGIDIPKPLVDVLGVPLFERNLHSILRAAVDAVVVSVPAGNDRLRTWIGSTIGDYERATGVPMELLVEETPLGNIGCAGKLAARAESVLVVYGDNLTTLDLQRMVAAHWSANADMTLAVHEHRFRMPFGEVQSSNGRVIGYAEKPSYAFKVCSGIAVLGEKSMAALNDGLPMGLSDLTMKLISSAGHVLEYGHGAAWIDVNTSSDVRTAEQLVSEHHGDFDLWAHQPELEARALVIRAGEVLLESVARTGLLTLPVWSGEPGRAVTFEFDDIASSKNHLVRTKVFLLLGGSHSSALSDGEWWDMREAIKSKTLDRTAARAIAVWLNRNQS
jgi:NDP-sugar pyrophosphorylase family protein